MGPADELLRRDRACVWHPYTQHGLERDLLPVAAAEGATLTLADGRVVLDAISSWWATLHGHGHPRLVEAAARQAATLDHVLFAGTTHEPAVGLAEDLVAVVPPGLTRVFFSDDGSTAVEVALKMALAAFWHRGQPGRRVFVALEGGYHGDTFGAMSVGDPEPLFRPYRPLLFETVRVPADVDRLERAVAGLGERCAGVVIEPLVQGAAGMVMHPPAFVFGVRTVCDAAEVPLIADEVMTGFGRTGTLFACEQAGVAPDVLCLSKGLTGGTFPLAVTLAREALFEAFWSEDRSRAFFHGHTFTAHPVGCAIARTSLALCRESRVPDRLEAIGARVARAFLSHGGCDRVTGWRRTGGIVACELATPGDGGTGYLAPRALAVRAAALERGVLLRPLGDTLYAMPPACTTEAECDTIGRVMAEVAAAEQTRVGGA